MEGYPVVPSLSSWCSVAGTRANFNEGLGKVYALDAASAVMTPAVPVDGIRFITKCSAIVLSDSCFTISGPCFPAFEVA